MLLKQGNHGEQVKTVQEILALLGYQPGKADGVYGEKTEEAVVQFQEAENLYADGVVGPNTWRMLQKAFAVQNDEQFSPPFREIGQDERLEWVRVEADKYRDGYNRFFLREDAAQAYLKVREQVLEMGAVLTSSGARRSLNANVGAARSATSFHYTGLALDLFVGSGMENRSRDPYLIAPDGDRYWRVYARADGGQAMEIDSVTYGSRKSPTKVSGKFIDLTALFAEQGFQRIRARRSFFSGGTWLGAEWWHFQYEANLVSGKSTFGEQLLKVYSLSQLEDSPPWRFRDRIFGVNWF